MSHTKLLLASEQATLNKAAAEFALKKTILDALTVDAEIKAINAFGYCADAMLIFKDASQLKELAAALKPLPCTEVKGFSWTVKPTAYVRATDEGTHRQAAPFQVIYQKMLEPTRHKSAVPENHVRWWTTVADKTVEVHVENVPSTSLVEELFDAQRFEAQGHSYATGSSRHWTLRRKRVRDLGPLISYVAQGEDKWQQFLDTQGFNAKQAQFVNAIKWSIRSNLTAQEALDYFRSQPRLNERLGFIDTCLTPEQLGALSAFYEEQRKAKAEVETAITAALDIVKNWTLQFFANKGNPVTNSHSGNIGDLDLLRYLIARDTGFAGNLHFVMGTAKPGVVQVQYTLDGRTIVFEAEFDVHAPNMDWDEYADYF